MRPVRQRFGEQIARHHQVVFRDKHVLQDQITRIGPAHAKRIPFAFDGQTRGILGHHENHRVFMAWLDAF